MCRELAHLPPQPAINLALAAIVEKCFPAELATRKAELEMLTDAKNYIPLFIISTCLLPSETLQLHVFETGFAHAICNWTLDSPHPFHY